MTMDILIPIIQTILISMLIYYLQRSRNKRDKKEEEHEKARKHESILIFELIMASAKLSYACAVALKRGETNGEVEEGIAAYKEAKEKYYEFLNEKAKEYLE